MRLDVFCVCCVVYSDYFSINLRMPSKNRRRAKEKKKVRILNGRKGVLKDTICEQKRAKERKKEVRLREMRRSNCCYC